MPKFKDTVTGQVIEFDHEPTQAEMEAKFGITHAQPGSGILSAEDEKSSLIPGAAGITGGIVGGKLGGPMGAGLGAASGTAFGDIYNMLQHGAGETTPMSEAKRLAEVGIGTAVGEKVLPKILGFPKQVLDRVGLSNRVAGLATLFGHPAVAGAKIGAEASALAGEGIDWLRTPLKGLGGEAEAAAPVASAHLDRSTPVQAGSLTQAQLGERLRAPAPTGPAPAAKPGLGRSILDGLKEGFESQRPAPQIPAAAAAPQARPRLSSEVPYNISEDMLPDASHVKATSGGQEGMVYPNMTREPNLKYGADVSAAPMRTPDLTQLAPTDPAMPWEEHMSRSAPKRAAPGGRSFDAVEVGMHPDLLKSTESSPWSTKITPQALEGLADFGPNTVGAAQRQPYLPSSVNENKGMSLGDADAWATAKSDDPSLSDSHLDDWFRSNKLGGNPHEGKPIPDMIDALMNLLGQRK